MDSRKDLFFSDSASFRAVIENRLILSESLTFLPVDDYRRLPCDIAAESRLFFDTASLSRERIHEIRFHFQSLGLALPIFIDNPDDFLMDDSSFSFSSKSFPDVHYDFSLDYGTLNIADNSSQYDRNFSRSGEDYLEMIDVACHSEKHVLLLGESGVGKDFLAEKIHRNSCFRDGPFYNKSVADWNPGLIESEMFGSVAGAYSGAKNYAGAFESAGKGTLFLNEIGLLEQDIQAKLLGVLGNRKFSRVGSSEVKTARCRYIFGTDLDLASMVRSGKFKPQLFYRISVIVIKIPPLRKRKNEIPFLAREFCRIEGKSISDNAVEKLVSHDWPGNVRELENCIQRSCAIAWKKQVLGKDDIILYRI